MNVSYDCVDFKGISISDATHSNYTNSLFCAVIQDAQKNNLHKEEKHWSMLGFQFDHVRGKSRTTKFAATSPPLLPAGASYSESCLHGSIKWSPLIFETKLVLNQQSGAAHSDVLCIYCIHCPLESSHVIFLPAATYSGLFVVLFSAVALWDYVCNLFLSKESINCT